LLVVASTTWFTPRGWAYAAHFVLFENAMSVVKARAGREAGAVKGRFGPLLSSGFDRPIDARAHRWVTWPTLVSSTHPSLPFFLRSFSASAV